MMSRSLPNEGAWWDRQQLPHVDPRFSRAMALNLMRRAVHFVVRTICSLLCVLNI